MGPLTISSGGTTTEDSGRVSIFTNGTALTNAQLFIAASGSASKWEPATSSKTVPVSALKISDWDLRGAGAEQAKKTKIPAKFTVTINKNKKQTGPEYRFKTYSEMDGYAADVAFVGISVTGGSWVQQYEATGEWVCSDKVDYTK